MVRVTVEILPGGREDKKRLLGIAEIANDGTSTTPDLGNYTVKLSKWAPMEKETWKAGRVAGFRRRALGSWDLLYQALRATVGSRNR